MKYLVTHKRSGDKTLFCSSTLTLSEIRRFYAVIGDYLIEEVDDSLTIETDKGTVCNSDPDTDAVIRSVFNAL